MTFFRFKAYAIGFYVDDDDIANVLAAQRDWPMHDFVAKQQALLDSVLAGAAHLGAALKPTGTTVGNHLLQAWVYSMKSKLVVNVKCVFVDKFSVVVVVVVVV